MEAGALRRGAPAPLTALAEAERARSRVFWIVAGLTAAAALLYEALRQRLAKRR